MKYHDYHFEIDTHGNLWMDEELEFDRFKCQEGECYQIQQKEGQIVFVRLRKPYSVVPFPPGP